jgi:hypothetical protein
MYKYMYSHYWNQVIIEKSFLLNQKWTCVSQTAIMAIMILAKLDYSRNSTIFFM